MIRKILAAAAIAAPAGLIAASPALADPASFGDLSCSCQSVPQQFIPSSLDPLDEGIQQGFSDTKPGALPDGIPHR